MKQVSIREFRANLSKYLEEDCIEITKSGKVLGVYTKSGAKSIVAPLCVHKFQGKDKIKLVKIIFPNTYACGCKKVDKKLCPKHGRS